MKDPRRFYTYAYLREDGTPYYVGKGEGNRAYYKRKGEIKPSKDKSRIIILKENLKEDEAFKHEIYMIAVFGRKDLGTGILHNRTNGGDGTSGLIHSEETRKNLSIKIKGDKNPNYGKPLSEETRRKLSEVMKGRYDGKNNPNYGKSHSEKSKKIISIKNKGKKISEETKRKMSESRKGRNNPNYGKTHSEETRRKLSEVMKGENHPFYGKSHSEDTKRKQSEAKKGKKWWNDGKGNNKICLECPGEGWVLGRKILKIS